jgi:hypothetical protein
MGEALLGRKFLQFRCARLKPRDFARKAKVSAPKMTFVTRLQPASYLTKSLDSLRTYRQLSG